jgi:hypothetical protein
MPFKSEKQRKWMHATKPKMAKKWEKEKKDEAAERDYKDEYKKFQSSDKSKKYRAELNQYNRKKGTYGNGDNKDASHKGGKIAGFEAESKNRGRAEKSRLKKEAKTVSIDGEQLMNFLMKRFKYNKKQAIATMKKHKMDTSFLKKESPDFNPMIDMILDDVIDEYQTTNEKVLKKNPGEFVDAKFSKAIDKLPNSKLTKDLVIKLAKKYKVDQDDALRFVSYGYLRDFGLKESVHEGKFGKFDTGAAFKGNGLTIYDRNQSQGGDYKNIAHISEDGKITIWDKNIKKETKLMQALKKISNGFKASFKESVNETVYQFKKYTNTQMDKLDALLSRAGYKGKPDFNKMTWTTKDKNSKIEKIIKSKGGKKIKESVDEAKVKYDFSDGELIRVLRQLLNGASGERGMIKAFERALGRKITNAEKSGTGPVESVNEKMDPEQYHKYMQYVFDTQFKTPEEKKMKKSIVKKINVGQKKKGLPLFKESVNENQKRQATDVAVKFDKAYLNFSREIRDIIKMVVRITGNRTDGKIFDKAYRKQLIPFDALFKSWYKGQQDNPHIKESDLGLTYKKGKTVKVKHKKSGKSLVIVDKPAVRKEYEKIGFYAESVDEMKKLFTIKNIKKAITIAKKMKGNMTGAVKKIEKMNRGLSDEPDVAAALKKANESVNEISGVDLAKRVLKNKSYEKGIDLQTANLIVTIDKAYDKNPALQKKFRAIPLPKMKQLVMKYYG